MHLGYAYKCHNRHCKAPIDKTKPYLVFRKPTKEGIRNEYYHPYCYKYKGWVRYIPDLFERKKNGIAGYYIGPASGKEAEVQLG
jgi:hypothetical protein